MLRFLVIVGILLVILGLGWPWIGPWVNKLHLGHLPGDITLHLGGATLYLPFTTCVIISVVIAFILWLIGR